MMQLSNFSSRKHQSGVVLFIAMVALVVMSLAAVALIRSVDTNSLIAGNLSYNQSAQVSSSYGIESIADQLGAQTVASKYAESDHAGDGYYATCKLTYNPNVIDTRCLGGNLTSDLSWVPGTTSRLATGAGLTNGVDAYGNRIQYIVERMCTTLGEASEAACLLSRGKSEGKSMNSKGESLVGAPEDQILPLYRITVRVDGPKNSRTFIQAFIS